MANVEKISIALPADMAAIKKRGRQRLQVLEK